MNGNGVIRESRVNDFREQAPGGQILASPASFGSVNFQANNAGTGEFLSSDWLLMQPLTPP
jgi:hypothetical protein